MKASEWQGLPHYARYSAWQRNLLIRMDRGLIRLAKFAVIFVPFCVCIAALRTFVRALL